MAFTLTTSANTSLEELARIFNLGFSGYFTEVNMTAETFGDFIRAYQIDLARSVVALGPEGEAGGCGVLGIRGKRGWLGGYGIAPDQRGSGLALQLLNFLLSGATKHGLEQVALEVLYPNERARKLYLRAGFEVSRELVLYEGAAATIQENFAAPTLAEERELEPAVALASFGMPEQNREFPPVWQRETPSILGQRGARAKMARLPSGERAVLLFLPNPIRWRASILHAGFDVATGEEARAALVSALLNSVVAEFGPATENTPAAGFNLLNEPEGTGLSGLLTKLGFTEHWRQYEMVIKLTK